jgi:hypothetical protein
MRKLVDWSPLQTACRPNQDEHPVPVVTQFAVTFAADGRRLREKSKFSPFFYFYPELANRIGK